MTNVDQFESVFRSAAKEPFRAEDVRVASVLVVTDLEADAAALLMQSMRNFLSALGPDTAWNTVDGSQFRTVPELLEIVEGHRPDLICTYRHLHSEGWKLPFTLGDHVEVLTQATKTPVMVLPHPEAGRASAHAMTNTDRVMAITDHLAGDHHLINWAIHLTAPGGTLYLTHVEDDLAFRRYIDVVSKIPEIDTDVARELIGRQLLKEPNDYIASCRTSLEERRAEVTIEGHVTLGHTIETYRALVGGQEIDLLVMNTKDDEQLAMHGRAYPLAVELREIPLLML